MLDYLAARPWFGCFPSVIEPGEYEAGSGVHPQSLSCLSPFRERRLSEVKATQDDSEKALITGHGPDATGGGTHRQTRPKRPSFMAFYFWATNRTPGPTPGNKPQQPFAVVRHG